MLVDMFFDVCHLHVGIRLFLVCGGASNASTHGESQRHLQIGGVGGLEKWADSPDLPLRDLYLLW